MIRQGSLRRPAAHEWVAALFDVAGIALWLLALSGVLSPHPWVFMLLGLAACVLEVVAIVLATMARSKNARSRVLTICLLLGGALPPMLVLVLAIVASP
jgi:drug/metabolite transporter (DMT)-like permease